MADDSHVIRGINWRETFPFTHLFRTFRIAIHPSKLVLALLAVLAIYIGGRILDGVWMAADYRAVPGELALVEGRLFGTEEPGISVAAWRQEIRAQARWQYAAMLQELAVRKPGPEYRALADREQAREAAAAGSYTDDVEYMLGAMLRERLDEAARAYEQAEVRDAAAARARDAAYREAMADYRQSMNAIEAIEGRGIFITCLEYATRKVDQIVFGLINFNWIGPDSVLWGIAQFIVVPLYWGFAYHWFYALLFAAMFMVLWSVLGGAIARIAAVHAADEGRKLSIRQGLSFSISKFLSFVSAPLIPLGIVGLIGLVISLVALALFAIWLDIVVGVLFFLALGAGFVMTLVLLGTVGGMGLMYPTIAVEGSDSFDAISRSFSYVYAKPWRMLFYTLVALAYGALTFLFVRLFIWMTLGLTHFFVGWFTGALDYRDPVSGMVMWNLMFPSPEFADLPYEVGFALLGTYSGIAAWFIALWNYLLIAMLGAFAISFYFSANTIIYYLMRREVDATDMDDVYLEQPEDDFVETPVAPATEEPETSAVATEPASPPPATSPEQLPESAPPPESKPE